MAKAKPKGEKFDLSFMFKLLSNRNIPFDKAGVSIFLNKFAKGETKTKPNDLVAKVLEASAKGFRYGLEGDKGSKRFAQDMVDIIFSGAVKKHKTEMREQDKAERKEMAKLRYYLPENVEARFEKHRQQIVEETKQSQIEKDEKIRKLKEKIVGLKSEESDDDKSPINYDFETYGDALDKQLKDIQRSKKEQEKKIKDISKEVGELGVERSNKDSIADNEAILDYAKNNFTLKEKERTINAPDMSAKAREIFEKGYEKQRKKVVDKIDELNKKVEGIGGNVVDVQNSINGEIVYKQRDGLYRLGGVKVENLISVEDFKRLNTADQIRVREALDNFYQTALRTKGKRQQYVRENIYRYIFNDDSLLKYLLTKAEKRDIILEQTGVDIFDDVETRVKGGSDERQQFMELFGIDIWGDKLQTDTMFELHMNSIAKEYVNEGQALLNALSPEDRESVGKELRKEFKFKERELSGYDNYYYIGKELKETGSKITIPEKLIQYPRKENIFGKQINTSFGYDPNEIKDMISKKYKYLRTKDETLSILNDPNKTWNQKKMELSFLKTPKKTELSKEERTKNLLKRIQEVESGEQKIAKKIENIGKISDPKISKGKLPKPIANKQSDILKQIRDLERQDLEEIGQKRLQKLEIKRQEAHIKGGELQAPQNIARIQSERLARREKKQKQDFAMKLASLGLRPKKSPSAKQAIQNLGLRPLKAKAKKMKKK